MTHLDETSCVRAYDYLMRRQKRAEVFLLIREEFGIGIYVMYSPGQKKKPMGPRAVGAFRGRERKEAKEAREQGERSSGRRKEGNAEEKKEEEVKKTRASWRRLFAWVSLGGRRVCLVESAADL